MTTLTEKTIDALNCSGVALEQAEKLYLEKKASNIAVSKAIPLATKAVLSAGLIDNSEVKDFERVLNSPEKTILFLTKVANHHAETISNFNKNSEVNTSMGKPVGKTNGKVKTASINTGGRSAELKESDYAFYRAVGVSLPDGV